MPQAMDDASRHYLWRAALTNFVANVAINAGLAWWILDGSGPLTAWGASAYGPDLLLTGFLLALIVAAIGIETHRRKAQRGELLGMLANSPDWLDAASRWNRWLAFLAFGLLGAALSGAALAALSLATASLPVPAYALLKGLWAGLLAALIVWPATLLGLRRGAAAAAPVP